MSLPGRGFALVVRHEMVANCVDEAGQGDEMGGQRLKAVVPFDKYHTTLIYCRKFSYPAAVLTLQEKYDCRRPGRDVHSETTCCEKDVVTL